MLPTLAWLVQHPTLRLRVVTGEDRLGTEVRWVTTSELTDPTPYLDGGELLLTTGLKLDVHNPSAMDAYVVRLRGAGVVALGFGTGVNHPELPPALVTACHEAGVPLLDVDRPVPFIAIGKAVSGAIAAEEYRLVAAGFAAQRELTRAALSEDGYVALLDRLAGQVAGWAALYDNSGAVTEVAPAWARRRAGRLGDEVRRLRDRPPPASAVAGGGRNDGGADSDRVELQSIGTGAVPRAVLAIGTEGPPGTAARYAVQSAVAVLTLLTERSRALDAAERRVAGAVLHLLLSGEVEHARAVGGEVYRALLDAPLRALVADFPDAADATAFAHAAESAAARAGEPVLVVPDGTERTVLAADAGAAVAAGVAYLRDQAAERERFDGALGVSTAVAPEAARSAVDQARKALLLARRRGRPVLEHDDIATGSVLPLLADDAVRAFGEGLLRPLREHDARGRGDLVASLRAWLSRHGQWDAAAADLGVHRHTLRYRMRRVEELLRRQLDDPDVRMELWLALKATG